MRLNKSGTALKTLMIVFSSLKIDVQT